MGFFFPEACPYFSPKVHHIEQVVIIDPKVLLLQLRNIINTLSEDKIKWARTLTTGFISVSEINSIASFADENMTQVITEFLECIGLIFQKPKPSNITGQEYFMPYFAQVPSSSEPPSAGKRDLELCLKFSEHEAPQTFYVLVFALASTCDTPDSLTIHSASCAVLYHLGLQVTVHHQKLIDKVKFIFRR